MKVDVKKNSLKSPTNPLFCQPKPIPKEAFQDVPFMKIGRYCELETVG